ncbi:hypothetical protein ANCCAN_14185 [Ancylostoma caninum]|uniref:Uncharacterized protein n=1 Tax=Ancylostoma caninum TaxID=29170 RepID=A0A368GA50_ANCCA|nr:hypothetical protein ANCCAN_14185 [Ancylostoma caninum]
MLSHNRIRKNVGYIYAIKRGAKFIYDLDEDMEMSGTEFSLFDYEESVSGLLYSTKNDLPTRLFYEVLTFLDSWKCLHEQISMCMVTLADEFRLKGYWDKESTTIVRIWVDNLIPLGYNFPSIPKDGFDCQPTFDETSRDQNCRRANIHLPYSLRTGTNMSEEITAMMTSALEDLTNWCAQGNYSEPECIDKEQHQDELAPTNANNSVHHTHLNKVLVIINNHPRKKGIGMLQRLYQPYFGMTIFCGSYSPMEYRDEGEFLEIIHPFNYIHISRGELLQGYFFHYCLAKVKELRLQNVEGYFFTADDAIFHFWHALDLSEILFPVRSDFKTRKTDLAPNNSGRRAAERAVQLFTTKYKHNKRISKVLGCYQEGVRFSNFSFQN